MGSHCWIGIRLQAEEERRLVAGCRDEDRKEIDRITARNQWVAEKVREGIAARAEKGAGQ